MAETLRELVTRFGFDVDKAGVDRFNQTVGGMKKQIVGLAGALGVGLGGRQILRLGTDARQTEVALKTAVSGIEGGFDLVSGAIERARTDLGNLGEIVTPQEGQAIAASFFGAFEDVSDDTLGTFETFLRAAVTLAAQTGGEVTDTFSAIFQAAREGVIEPLQALPGITAETARQFQFVTGLLGQIDPTNVAQLAVNMSRVRQEIEKVLPDVEKFVQQNAEDLLAARRASAELEEGLQNLGSRAVKALQEPLDILSTFVGKLNEGKGATDALSESLAGVKLPPAIQFTLQTLGILPEERQTPQQRARAERQETISPFLPESLERERQEAQQRKQRAVEFFGGEESTLGAALQSILDFSTSRDEAAGQPVPVVIEQPGEPIIVTPPATEQPAPRERPSVRPAPAGVPLPAQAPIPAAISRLESQVQRMTNAQRSRTEIGESKLEVKVIAEGRVLTFPDMASFQRDFGEILGRIAVEFEPTETTEAP